MAGLHIIHYSGTFALFAAMALLIVASVSLFSSRTLSRDSDVLEADFRIFVLQVSSPIWDSVGYLKGEIQGQGITFGNWGWCTSAACTSAKLGYPRNFISQLTGSQNIASETVLRNLSYTLILTPIAAGITFIALLFALGTHLVLGILGSLAALLAFIVTIVALGVSLRSLLIVSPKRRTDTALSLFSSTWVSSSSPETESTDWASPIPTSESLR